MTAVTAANTKGTTAVASTSNTLGVYATSYAYYNSTSTWATVLTTVYNNPSATPLIDFKSGDNIAYTAGWKTFATTVATAPVTSGSGSGKWTLVDGASALTLSAGVAAAVAMLSF